ncbi:MAG: polyprenyl synthetase family protein [Planctomycetota bacterium]
MTACCCGLSAHYAGASSEVENAMSNYGRELGIAFQIADDMLDLLSDEAASGKSLGSDLAKQKLTLPIIRLRNTADRAAPRRLSTGLGKSWPDSSQGHARIAPSLGCHRICHWPGEGNRDFGRESLERLGAQAARMSWFPWRGSWWIVLSDRALLLLRIQGALPTFGTGTAFLRGNCSPGGVQGLACAE